MRFACFCLVASLIAGSLVPLQAQVAPATLVIDQQTAPPAGLGTKFSWGLTASGGTSPYFWQIVSGQLPPGLALDRRSGRISGTPAKVGQYPVSVAVTDSSSPPRQAQSNFTLTVTSPTAPSPLTLDWKVPPRVQGSAVAGSVEVANHSEDAFDLTVIVLAVNETGRATALGYQHFEMPAGTSQVIPFEASPGAGKYVVHADAVAEVPEKNAIYRARRQTRTALHLNQ